MSTSIARRVRDANSVRCANMAITISNSTANRGFMATWKDSRMEPTRAFGESLEDIFNNDRVPDKKHRQEADFKVYDLMFRMRVY